MADHIRILEAPRAKARYNWRIIAALLLNIALWGVLIVGGLWLKGQ